MQLSWCCKSFDALTVKELYSIIQLRETVFVVEQNCVYLDADGKDEHCFHVFGMDEFGAIVATSRIVPKGVSYPDYVSIGRVCVAEKLRKYKIGQQLMQETIVFLEEKWGSIPIKISAQSYLINFYQKFGFVTFGAEYLEDAIPHTAMIKK